MIARCCVITNRLIREREEIIAAVLPAIYISRSATIEHVDERLQSVWG